MLRIQQQQFTAFEEASVRSFVRRMTRHLRHVLPEAIAHLDDAALRESTQRRVAQALSYGITDRLDLLRYLESSHVLGWTDEGPDGEARAALARTELGARERVDLIEQRTASM